MMPQDRDKTKAAPRMMESMGASHTGPTTGLCGAVTTDISPETPLPMAGRKNRPDPFTSVESPLEAGIITFPGKTGKVVIVGLDTLFASHDLKDSVLAQLSAPVRANLQDIVFIATHTHNAPALDQGKPELGLRDDGYSGFVSARIARAIERLAGQDGETVTVQHGRGSCTLNSYRRGRGIRITKRPPMLQWTTNMVPVRGVDISHDIDVVVGRNARGEPDWVLWSWPCHPTSSPDPQQLSADFPGHVRKALRKKFGNDALPVLFLPGFCGDIRSDISVFPFPWKSLVSTPFQRPFATASQDSYARICDALSRAVCGAVSSAQEIELTPGIRTARTGIALSELMDNSPPGAMDIVAIHLGGLGLMLVSAEVCSPYDAICRDVLPGKWLLSGYTGEVFGYLPGDRQIARSGYEVDDFRQHFGLSAHRFRDHIEDIVTVKMTDVARRVSE